MNSDTELEGQKERNLLSSIKEFRVPWKDFLSWNLLFLVVWIFSLLYMFIWAPASQPSDPGFFDFNADYRKANPLEWAIFNYIYMGTVLRSNTSN